MREIREGPDFEECVKRLGGYRAIDEALDTVYEALSRNPYGCPHFEHDLCKVRYVKTKPISWRVPALVVIFTIDEQNNVTLEWIEQDYDDIPF